jgi:hypothetical protein
MHANPREQIVRIRKFRSFEDGAEGQLADRDQTGERRRRKGRGKVRYKPVIPV